MLVENEVFRDVAIEFSNREILDEKEILDDLIHFRLILELDAFHQEKIVLVVEQDMRLDILYVLFSDEFQVSYEIDRTLRYALLIDRKVIDIFQFPFYLLRFADDVCRSGQGLLFADERRIAYQRIKSCEAEHFLSFIQGGYGKNERRELAASEILCECRGLIDEFLERQCKIIRVVPIRLVDVERIDELFLEKLFDEVQIGGDFIGISLIDEEVLVDLLLVGE